MLEKSFIKKIMPKFPLRIPAKMKEPEYKTLISKIIKRGKKMNWFQSILAFLGKMLFSLVGTHNIVKLILEFLEKQVSKSETKFDDVILVLIWLLLYIAGLADEPPEILKKGAKAGTEELIEKIKKLLG